MKKALFCTFCLLLFTGALSGCDTAQTPAVTPAVTPAETPAETSSPSPAAATPTPPAETKPPLDINGWTKEMLSNKPGDTHFRYYTVDENKAEKTMLDVYNITEEHDIDGDGSKEIVEYLKGRVGIGIHDAVSGELKYYDVNKELGCDISEYTGNIGNIRFEYSTCIEAEFKAKDGSSRYEIYRYDGGKFTYVCSLDDALRK